MQINQVTVDKVVRSYNGKVGCACGCNGTYSLKSADDIAAANKACGWEANDESNVRPRAVAAAVRKINQAILEFGDLAKPSTSGNGLEYSKGDVWFFACNDFISVDRNGRNSTVYFSL